MPEHISYLLCFDHPFISDFFEKVTMFDVYDIFMAQYLLMFVNMYLHRRYRVTCVVFLLWFTLQDIFIRFEMWRFSENSAIFSDRQNFGRRNRIRHIIFKLILITVASPLHVASEK